MSDPRTGGCWVTLDLTILLSCSALRSQDPTTLTHRHEKFAGWNFSPTPLKNGQAQRREMNGQCAGGNETRIQGHSEEGNWRTAHDQTRRKKTTENRGDKQRTIQPKHRARVEL